MYVLHIADQAYSSWSLRGWLLLEAFGLKAELRLHRLYDPAFDAFQAEQAPARTVPMLAWEQDGVEARVWDSLAIAETLAERHPDAGHWPTAPDARAAARSLAAEMHAGFAALRAGATMNTRRVGRPAADPSPAMAADLARLATLWAWAQDRWGAGGPWLFGARFTAADAFFAPIAFRINGYALAVPPRALAYADALRAHPAVAAWAAAAMADPRRIARYDDV